MVAVKLGSFGGMVPAQDDRLLPDNAASHAENTWLYAGRLEGVRPAKLVHAAANPATRCFFRIPKGLTDRDHIADSYWLEFLERNTTVIKSPISEDDYSRYYIASPSAPPSYNTLGRIINGQPALTLGIPAPGTAPVLSSRPKSPSSMKAGVGGYGVLGQPATLSYRKAYAVDTGGNGVRTAPSSDHTASWPLQVGITGFPAELRFKTSIVGDRSVVENAEGTVTGTVPIPADPESPVLVSRAYVYTWVSEYGEEGPPSEPTLLTGLQDGVWTVGLTAPTTGDTTSRNLAKVRIYRTISSAAGTAAFYQVAELPISTLTYEDATADVAVVANATLESTGWTAPPEDLQGFVTLPNGMVAGWRANEVWYCEPYRPHAWPAAYTITVDYPIVALGVINQSLIVLTTAFPYAATGVNPASVSLSVIAANEPCTSRGSVVSTPEGVYYTSPNGLMVAVPGAVRAVLGASMSKDRWLSLLNINTLRAARLGTAYYCWGAVASGCFSSDAFNNDAFLQGDYTGAYKGALVDLANPTVGWSVLTNDSPVENVIADVWTSEVFVVRGGQVFWADVTGTEPGEYLWRSKVFQTPQLKNFQAVRVFFLPPSDGSAPGVLRTYADGRLVSERPLTKSGGFMRLPSGFKTEFWQFEIEGKAVVYNVQAATTAKELMNV